MSGLPPDASMEDIEDELIMQQTLLDSLGPEVAEDDHQRTQLISKIAALESQLENFTSPSASGESPSAADTDSTSVSGMTSTGSAGSKRPGEPLNENGRSSSKRPALNDARDRSWSFDPIHATQSSKPSRLQRYLQQQQQAEEAARRRKEEERFNEQMAMQLSQGLEYSPPIAGPSRPTPAVQAPRSYDPRSHAPIFNPSYGRPAPPTAPAKPERVSTHSHYSVPGSWPSSAAPYSNHAAVKPEPTDVTGASRSGPFSSGRRGEVIDLTDDDPAPSRARPQNTYNDFLQRQADQIIQEGKNSGRSASEIFRMREEGQRSGPNQGFVYGTPPSTAPGPMWHRTPGPPNNPLAHIYQPYPSSSMGIMGTQARSQINKVIGGAGRTLNGVYDQLSEISHLVGATGFENRLASNFEDIKPYSDPYGFEDRSAEEVAEDLKNLVDNIRPDDDTPIDERDVEIDGMTVSLKPYQGVGLTWLQNAENGTNKGGILADDMGLGKTVQAIALMATHPSEDPTCRTTLIIAPVALLRQWKEEIRNKLRNSSRHRLSVFVHHGTTKKKSFSALSEFDVVLTTFGTLASEMRRREKFDNRRHYDPGAVERADEKCIFIDEKSKWYRIIIDEAQNIKNRNTKAARGAYRLNAKTRFCMTGTPMMNSVDELHSLLQFLRIKPYNDWQRFSNDFSKPIKGRGEDSRKHAMQKLQVLLKAVLLRRHKRTKVNGKPILVLPERVVEETNPEFTVEERDFYKAIETQSQIQFNKYVNAGTVGKSYAHILVMLLRLRQACCHPHLVKDFAVAAAANISEEEMVDYAKSLEEAVVNRIKEADGSFECPVCFDAIENPAIFVPCGHHTCPECYTKIKDASLGQEYDENNNRVTKCPQCRGNIDPKMVIDYETFKKVHVPVPEMPEMPAITEGEAAEAAAEDAETESDSDATESEADSDEDDDEDGDEDETDSLDGFIVDDTVEDSEAADEAEDVKPSVAAASTRADGSRVSPIEDSDDDVKGPSAKAKGKRPVVLKDMKKKTKKSKNSGRRKSKKGKKVDKGKSPEKKVKKKYTTLSLAELKRASMKNKAAKKEYFERIRENWVPSAKIEKTMELLDHIMNDTDEKIILFSQWTSLLDLIELPIDSKNWSYERYDGSMNATDRGDAVQRFREEPNRRIMLVSLKAGNAGLNLNFASQVIILDPFWNPYIEEQAIDRAHRLGQNRDVKVHRLLIQETVEDRIIALQEKKREMINEALDDGAGQRLSRLTVAELGYLFGIRKAG
ncbi:hypothetical protein MBLNU457_g0176t1 [Dothideomycetes sp. NU457]